MLFPSCRFIGCKHVSECMTCYIMLWLSVWNTVNPMTHSDVYSTTALFPFPVAQSSCLWSGVSPCVANGTNGSQATGPSPALESLTWQELTLRNLRTPGSDWIWILTSDSAIESRRKKTSCRCADRWSCFRSGAREKQTRTNEQTGELWAFIDPLPQDQFKINSSRFKSHRLLQVASTWLPFRSKLDKVTQSANCIKLHPIKSNVEMNV